MLQDEKRIENASAQAASLGDSSALELLKDDVKQAEGEVAVGREKEQLLQLEVLDLFFHVPVVIHK